MKEVGVMCLPSRKLLRTIDHQRSDNAGMQFVHTVQLDLSRHAHNLADGNHKVKRYSGQKFVTALCRFELLKIPKTDWKSRSSISLGCPRHQICQQMQTKAQSDVPWRLIGLKEHHVGLSPRAALHKCCQVVPTLLLLETWGSTLVVAADCSNLAVHCSMFYLCASNVVQHF